MRIGFYRDYAKATEDIYGDNKFWSNDPDNLVDFLNVLRTKKGIYDHGAAVEVGLYRAKK